MRTQKQEGTLDPRLVRRNPDEESTGGLNSFISGGSEGV